MKRELPEYKIIEFFSKKNKYALGIPVLNEGEKIQKQLQKIQELELDTKIDIIILDGNSSDDGVNETFLKSVGVCAKLIKLSEGRQGAQFRMGFDYILNQGYEGIITVDGNNKDSMENIANFIKLLDEGYDFIQGSRYINGGQAINTPFLRHWGMKLVHTPWIRLLSGFKYTETSSAYRGITKRLLLDDNLNIFREIFNGYELLYYMSTKSPRLNYKIIETPVIRSYPITGKTPTKITFWGNFSIIIELIKLTFKYYDSPKS